MSIFYTAAQVKQYISEWKEFYAGDEFIMAIKRQRYVLAINSDFILYVKSNREECEKIFWFNGNTSQKEFLYTVIWGNNRWNFVFGWFNTENTKKIIVALFERYEGMRKKYAKKFISNEVALTKSYTELNPKFYWELEFAPLRYTKRFWDWTSYLSLDIVHLEDMHPDNSEVPIFSQCFRYDGVFFRDIQQTIWLRIKSGNIYGVEKILNKKYEIIQVNWYKYDKKYFLSEVWGFCNVLNIYYIGNRELTPSANLKPYHWEYTKIIVRATDDSSMFFGIELEKSREVTSANYIKLAKDGWRCERDATVAAEYISPVLSLDKYEDSITFIKDTAEDLLDGEISNECGWHIHISVKWVDCNDLHRRCAIFMPLLWAIYPGRASNNYSYKPAPMADNLACNFRRDFVVKSEINTVEFRIFPGCKWEAMLRFRLRLLKAIVTQSLLFDENAGFIDALNFIMKSTEMFELLSYVYNSTDKMKWISERIASAYSSLKWIPKWIDVSSILIENVAEFVKNKLSIVDDTTESIVENNI